MKTPAKPSWLAFVTKRLAEIQDGCYTNGLVLIESPYAGNVRRNQAYLRACLKDSLARGEFPFASHGFYPLVLNDLDPDQRSLGIQAGMAWGTHADATAVYADLGISSGMALGIQDANERGRPICLRTLGGKWAKGKHGTRSD